MRRVQFPVAEKRVFRAPAGLAPTFFTKFDPTPVRIYPIVEFHIAQVVLVPALEVHQLAKKPLSDHVHHRHHVAPIANILQKHEWRACFLLHIDQLPAFIERKCPTNLGRHGLPGPHRRHGLLGVKLPWRGDQHRINGRILQ